MPLEESLPVQPRSPYAVSKAAGEWYGRVFSDLYGLDCVALRFFNVFGPRQDPESPYAAVIPRFVQRMLRGETPEIHGDGLQARDFTHVDNVVAGMLAAADAPAPISGVYNLACGQCMNLLELVARLNTILGTAFVPAHGPARAGDIRQSWADVRKASAVLGYTPVVDVDAGLAATVDWLRTQEGRG
jgi:UDP-glucose 4-epimerase